MSVVGEVKKAYTERTRQLNFRASRPVVASALSVVLKPIGRYNEFSPSRVASAINSVDSRASVLVGRDGSPVLFIKTASSKQPAMKLALRKAKADEIGVRKGWIRAWWD